MAARKDRPLRKIKCATGGAASICRMAPPTLVRSAAWLVFAFCAMAAMTEASAADGEPAGTEPADEKPQSRHRVREELLDRPHTLLSRGVETLSRDLDAVLGDSNRFYDSTGSTAQLRAHITNFEGGHTEGRAQVNARISLPNTEDRLNAELQRGLESSTETAAERDIRNVTGAAPDRLADNYFYVGLKALAMKVLGVQLSAEGGVRVRSTPDPYVRIRAFRDFTVSEWTLRLAETPPWSNADGSSAPTEGTLDRQLGERWHFRFTTKANWREATHYFDLGQIASLIHTPDPKTSDAGPRRIRPERTEPETDFLFNRAAHPPAGVPGLAVRRTDPATFLSSNQRLPCGRLPDAADRSAVRRPLSPITLKRCPHQDRFMPVRGRDALRATARRIRSDCDLRRPELTRGGRVVARDVRENGAGRASVSGRADHRHARGPSACHRRSSP